MTQPLSSYGWKNWRRCFKSYKIMLDKQRLLWYNTDVVERLGNLFLVSLLEYSPEHDDKRLKRNGGVG